MKLTPFCRQVVLHLYSEAYTKVTNQQKAIVMSKGWIY